MAGKRGLTTIGVEITPHDLHVAVVQRGMGRIRVLGASSFSTDGVAPSQSAQAVKKFLKEFPAAHAVRVCLSLPFSFVRLLDLPSTDETTLQRMIPYELERHLPFPADQIRYDYCVLAKSEDGMFRVLVAAVKKKEFEPIDQLIEQISSHHTTCTLGVLTSTEFIRNGSLAIAPGIDTPDSSEQPVEGIAVIDTCPAKMTITVSDGRSGFLTRSVESCSPDQLATEIRRALAGFRSLFHKTRVARCFLIGEHAQEVLSMVEDQVGIPVESTTPWFDMDSSQSPPLASQRYFHAIASALQDDLTINLLTSRQATDRINRRRRNWFIAGAAILAVALITGSYSFLGALHSKEVELSRLDQQVKKVQITMNEARGLSPTSGTANSVGTKADERTIATLARDARRSSYTCLELLRLLSYRLPSKVWLTELVYEKDKRVMLNGNAPTNGDIATALQVLEKTEFFQDVRLVHSRATGTKDKEGFDFQIACTMKLAERPEKR